MNTSGEAVAAISRFFKIKVDDVLVIHDDLELPLGKLKIKHGGSSGGHNGLKSISTCIGKEYHRLRLGIDRPTTKEEVSNYVLNKFKTDEKLTIEERLHFIKNHYMLLLQKQWTTFLERCLGC